MTAELTDAYWETDQFRAKYDSDDLDGMQKAGKTMPGPEQAYPIGDQSDLQKAIKAVGRGGADHDDIRKYIIERAHALKLSTLIPENWKEDGSLAEQAGSATRDAADGDGDGDGKKDGDGDGEDDEPTCKTCDGKGTIMDGHRKCPDCKGSGNKSDETTSNTQRRAKQRHRSGPAVGREFRLWSADDLEVRAGTGEGSDNIVITGSPIKYGVGYSVRDMLGEFEERMHQGVCADIIAKKADVRFLLNHDGLPLARTVSGTLTLTDSDDSLRMEANLDSRQQLANDLAIAIERGDVSQMSCGFVVGDDKWSADWTQRDVYKFSDMFDVSAVTYPASTTTSIQVAQRMVDAMPMESRACIRRLWAISTELRGGKVLSSANAQILQDALSALSGTDFSDLQDAINSHQANITAAAGGISGVLASGGGTKQNDADNDADDADPTGTLAADGTSAASATAPGDDGSGSRSARSRLQLELDLIAVRGGPGSGPQAGGGGGAAAPAPTPTTAKAVSAPAKAAPAAKAAAPASPKAKAAGAGAAAAKKATKAAAHKTAKGHAAADAKAKGKEVAQNGKGGLWGKMDSKGNYTPPPCTTTKANPADPKDPASEEAILTKVTGEFDGPGTGTKASPEELHVPGMSTNDLEKSLISHGARMSPSGGLELGGHVYQVKQGVAA